MKNSGLILRLGLVALFTAALGTVTLAQSAKTPGRKDTQAKISAPVVKKTEVKQASVKENGVQKATLNPKLAVHKRGALAANQGSASRNCTVKSNAKPYSITRANFNKLPKSRQEFVLQNANKYTIVD